MAVPAVVERSQDDRLHLLAVLRDGSERLVVPKDAYISHLVLLTQYFVRAAKLWLNVLEASFSNTAVNTATESGS